MGKETATCPECDSLEWFPGAACFHCGWEGSAEDAYLLLKASLAAKDAEIERLRTPQWPEVVRHLNSLIATEEGKALIRWHELTEKSLVELLRQARGIASEALGATQKESHGLREQCRAFLEATKDLA